MREGWQVVSLGDVCDFFRGLTYKKSDEVETSSNVVLRANNISLEDGALNFDELKYIRENIFIPDNKKIKKNALLVCTASGSKKHLGKIAFIDVDYDYAFGGFMGLLKPKKNINPKFLYWLTASNNYSDFISELSDGANINNLKFSQLGQFKIPLPPLPEQKRIVGILDEAFEGIATATTNAEKNLANARELFESYLNAIFTKKGEGWMQVILSDVCDVRDGTHDSPKYVYSGIPFLTQKNIRENGLSFEKAKCISELDHEKFYKRSNVSEGDILISMIGVNRGMSCLVDDDRTFSIKNVGLIKKNNNVNMHFLLYYLKSNTAKSYVEDESRGGAQPFIGLTKLRDFPVSLAPPDKQKTVVMKLDELVLETKRLEAIYQQKITAIAALKQAILQKAFAGELTTKPESGVRQGAVG